MQSKRDQSQAHSFMMGRLTAGMLMAEPDAAESPLRRTTRGVIVSIVVAVLVCGGAFVFGLLKPGGNSSWKTAGSLVVNKDTGARYLYLDGRLRPVLNYASARLIGGTQLTTSDVGTGSLSGTPVGGTVGIPGAPDSVPAPADLDAGLWQVCSTIGSGSGSAAAALTTVDVGGSAESTGLGTTEGVVVAGPDKTEYLVWQGSRLKLDQASGAAVSLGYGAVTPRPVSAAFLDALVAGPDLAAPDVPGRGDAGPQLGGQAATIGQVFQVRVPGSASQYYLLRREGLVPLTDTGAALVLGDPATREQAYGGQSPKAIVVGADALKQHLAPGAEGKSPSVHGQPDSPPHNNTVPGDEAACVRVQPEKGGQGARVTTVLVPKSVLSPITPAGAQDAVPGCPRVDGVVVRPGRGVLVHALAAGGTSMGDTTYLVADDGVKYVIPTSDALKDLGFSQSDAESLPSPLLAMMPSGPDLNPQAAMGAAAPSVTATGCAPAAPGLTPPSQGLAAASVGAPAGQGTAALGGRASVPGSGAAN
jgi:type VII secretion protein EccB